eukprot:TRINITY_DN20495_c0_g1_i5.p1 TRINITY_DN20495_c0_g1~~TRINITY_DN20495_c0_g1_i5.p1  ORF type:complete len:634 (-),score=95.48 TRINITY_DN20495_c0_g1_i5:57-1958(-)
MPFPDILPTSRCECLQGILAEKKDLVVEAMRWNEVSAGAFARPRLIAPPHGVNSLLEPILQALHEHFAELANSNLSVIVAQLQRIEQRLMDSASSSAPKDATSVLNGSRRNEQSNGVLEKETVEVFELPQFEKETVEVFELPQFEKETVEVFELPQFPLEDELKDDAEKDIATDKQPEVKARHTVQVQEFLSQRVLSPEALRCLRKTTNDCKVANSEAGGVSLSFGAALALDIIPAFMIALNAVVIGLSTDIEPDSDVWFGFECFFGTFFFSEILVNLRVAGAILYFSGPLKWWNIFDCFCVLLAIFDIATTILRKTTSRGAEVSGITAVKMIRMAKLLRLVRLMRFHVFTELKNIITGLFSGLRVLIWSQVLLCLIIYLGAIFMTNMLGKSHPEFSTVPASMLTLFRCFTDGCAAYDGTPLQARLFREFGAIIFVGWVVSYLFVTFGIFNLIMALFIEHVLDAQTRRRRFDINERSDGVYIRLQEIMTEMVTHYSSQRLTPSEWTPGSPRKMSEEAPREITRADFNKWLDNEKFVKVLEEADIDLSSKNEIFEVLDSDINGFLTQKELAIGLMRLRGPMRKTEIVATRLMMLHGTERMQRLENTIETLRKWVSLIRDAAGLTDDSDKNGGRQ